MFALWVNSVTHFVICTVHAEWLLNLVTPESLLYEVKSLFCGVQKTTFPRNTTKRKQTGMAILMSFANSGSKSNMSPQETYSLQRTKPKCFD